MGLFLCVFFLYPFLQIAFLAFTAEGGFTTKHFQTMASNWKFWPGTLRIALTI